MRKTLAGLFTVLALGLTCVGSAEAGWKWKKMKWVAKPGQEYRSPYGHDRGHHYGYGSGYGHGYGRGYGYERGYGYGRNYGYGRSYGSYGGSYGAPYGGYGSRGGW